MSFLFPGIKLIEYSTTPLIQNECATTPLIRRPQFRRPQIRKPQIRKLVTSVEKKFGNLDVSVGKNFFKKMFQKYTCHNCGKGFVTLAPSVEKTFKNLVEVVGKKFENLVTSVGTNFKNHVTRVGEVHML